MPLMKDFDRLIEIADALHGPNGCPYGKFDQKEDLGAEQEDDFLQSHSFHPFALFWNERKLD